MACLVGVVCQSCALQEVIRTICSPYGFVQRVVIFRKNGLQVLVEYPSQTCRCGWEMELCLVRVDSHWEVRVDSHREVSLYCVCCSFEPLTLSDLILTSLRKEQSSSWTELISTLVAAPSRSSLRG